MEDKSEVAANKFSSGYNCAQSVLYSFCDYLQLDKNLALKLACGFGAGMGRNQEVCGAVSGGILVIGIKHGRGINEDRQVTENTYKLTQELMNRFEQEHGSCVCRQLLDECNLLTEEGQKRFRENDYFNKICIKCVQSVVKILEKIC